MAGVTNRGKYLHQRWVYGGLALPTNFYLALVKTTPNADTNVMSDLTQVATGNGYTTGGYQLTPGATDFPTIAEDDTADTGTTTIKDIVWTASGGTLPSDGNGATYAVLTDDNATVANRQVIAFWSLGGTRVVSDTQALTVSAAKIQGAES